MALPSLRLIGGEVYYNHAWNSLKSFLREYQMADCSRLLRSAAWLKKIMFLQFPMGHEEQDVLSRTYDQDCDASPTSIDRARLSPTTETIRWRNEQQDSTKTDSLRRWLNGENRDTEILKFYSKLWYSRRTTLFATSPLRQFPSLKKARPLVPFSGSTESIGCFTW